MGDYTKLPKNLSRRDFLKSVGGTAAITGLALGGVAAPQDAAAECGALPKKWDASADIIVVGTGFAGLAAAIEARNAGADVLVIDKMPVWGGNSIINGGDFAAPGNKWQKEQGIQDSPDLMLKDMLKAGAYLNRPELARIVCEQSAEALEWCQTYIGAKFSRLNYQGGHSVRRAVQTDNASGSGLVNPMLAKAKELGVRVQLRTKLTRFLSNKDGRIVGIEVRKGYTFPDDSSGRPAYLKARRSMVLTSGGFSQDLKLRQIQDPRITEKFTSTNHPGATGEALLAACTAGAMTVQMDWIQLGPWTSPDEKGFGQVPQFTERIVGWSPMINPKTGKRFIKETGDRKVRADAIILIGEPVIIFGDSYAVSKNVLPITLEKAMEIGAIKKFGSLEELAKDHNIPLAPFKEEIARWNSFVEKKKDDDFDCMIFPDAKPTATPPFYAARLWPRVHYCMGGLVIDKNAQVMGLDFKPVKGLYAAGEVTGGVHGAVRLGSVAMATCVVFGRIAGRSAAKEQPWA